MFFTAINWHHKQYSRHGHSIPSPGEPDLGNTDFKNSHTETAHKAQRQVNLLGSVTQNRAQDKVAETKGKPAEIRKDFPDSGV